MIGTLSGVLYGIPLEVLFGLLSYVDEELLLVSILDDILFANSGFRAEDMLACFASGCKCSNTPVC